MSLSVNLPSNQTRPILQLFDLFGDGREYLNIGAALLFLSRHAPQPVSAQRLRTECRVSDASEQPARAQWPVVVLQRGKQQHVIDNNERLLQAQPLQQLPTLLLGEQDGKLLSISREEIARHSDPTMLRHYRYVSLLRAVPPDGKDLTFWLAAHKNPEEVKEQLRRIYTAVFGSAVGKQMTQRACAAFQQDQPLLLRMDEAPYQLQLIILPTAALQNLMN